MADSNVNVLITAEDRASRALQNFGGRMEKLGDRAKKLAKKMAKIGAVATAAGFVAATKAAIDFESSFAGVRKTVDASEDEFKQLSENFRNIAKETPVAVNELNRIAELAGQLGVSGVENITKFTKTIADIAVTTNLTEEEAATSFARIANIMQEPLENVDRIGAAVVDLGNNFATTEAEITVFANRIAGAGRTAGLSTADIFGIGAAFSSVGVQAERGGTAVSKALFAMANAVENGGDKLGQFADVAGITSKEFQKLFEEDAAKAFDKFILGLEENGIKATGLLEELELSDQRLMQSFISVAGAGGIMTDAIETAGKAWEENTALSQEAEKRYSTTASQLKILYNRLYDVGIIIGSYFLPALNSASEWIGKNIQPAFEAVVEKLQEWWPTIRDTAIAIGTYLAPKLEELWKKIQEEVIPALKDFWKTYGIPISKFVGIVLVTAIDKLIDILTVLADNFEIVMGVLAAFGTLIVGAKVLGAITALTGAIVGAGGLTASVKGLSAFLKGGALISPWGLVAAAGVGAAVAITLKWQETKRVLKQTQERIKSANDSLETALDNMRKLTAEGKATLSHLARTEEATLGRFSNKRTIFGSKTDDGSVYTPGFSRGGYTGGGGISEPAGIVHKGEYVVPREDVDQSTGQPKTRSRRGDTVNFTVNIGMYAGNPSERRRLAVEMFKDFKDLAARYGKEPMEMLG